MLDFEKIKQGIIANPSIVAEFLPSGTKVGPEYRCANIFGEKGDSFSINLNTGLWSDFATGESGSSLIDLVSKQRQISFREAAELIASKLGGVYEGESAKVTKEPALPKKEDILIPKKPPFPAPKSIYVAGKGETPIDDIWTYKNELGYVIGYDARVNHIDKNGKEKKDIYPLRWNGEKWYTKALPAPRPLYNLDKIAADSDGKRTVLIVEGCKTAVAAEHYFPNFTVVTWQGGCKAVKLADWASIYGRNVVIVPDADKLINDRTKDYFPWEEQPGMKAANQIAKILYEHRCFVRIVNTKAMAEMKSGWDLADALAGGMKQLDVVKFVKENIYEYVPNESEEDNPDIIEPEVIVNKKAHKSEYDDTYFICLGVEGKNHYFYQKTSGQVIAFTPGGYKKENLISLAPLAWWEAEFPQKQGVDWEGAVDWLCRVQEKQGVYDKKRIRGRGAWFDDGKPVLHLGTSLFVDGQIMKIDEFHTNYIYEKAPALAVKLQTVLPKEDSARLIDICRLARWEKPYYGDLLAGWMFSAMVCGAMPFRSHLYLIGAAGTGKSWMVDNVIKVIMGKMALSVSSKTTEPGVREALGGDIMPVIFDEAEAENKADRIRMQAIFDLARQASSEGSDAIYKGGSNGSGGFAYLCRSSFLFASINNSMTKDADMSRTTVIKLANSPLRKDPTARKKDNEAFRELERQVSMTFTPEYCRCLLTRAIQMIPKMRECAKVISNLCATEFGSKRIGDQTGMILAGIWCLKNDKPMAIEDARQLVSYCAIRKEKEDTGDDMTQEERALNHLVFSEVSFDRNKYPLAMLLSFLEFRENIDTLSRSNLSAFLANRGIKLENDNLILSRNEKALPAQMFKDTEWEGVGWKDALLRIDGVTSEKARRFCSGLVSGAVCVPLDLVLKG